MAVQYGASKKCKDDTRNTLTRKGEMRTTLAPVAACLLAPSATERGSERSGAAGWAGTGAGGLCCPRFRISPSLPSLSHFSNAVMMLHSSAHCALRSFIKLQCSISTVVSTTVPGTVLSF